MAKRKYTPTQKPPPLEQQPLTPKRPKVKVDPEPIYEEEEQNEQEEEEESQDFIDAYMDGDNDGGENVDEDDDAEDNNAEDTNEDEEVRDLSN